MNESAPEPVPGDGKEEGGSSSPGDGSPAAWRPLVSVILPVYNGERYLAEALESILRQRHRPLEILVVDDGSTDGTDQVLEQYREVARCVRQPNRGSPAARNVGLGQARGDVIGFLDADDLWVEDKLALQLDLLASNGGVEVVQGRTQRIERAPGSALRPGFVPSGEPTLVPSLGSALFRKSAFELVGRLDESQRYGDDVDWFLRAQELRVPMVSHPEVTQFYRRHDHNITNQRRLDQHFFMMALKKSLDRRRDQRGMPATPMAPWFVANCQGDGAPQDAGE